MLFMISDASVLIDVECGGISTAMFSLPYQFIVPDILFSEELSKRHAHLLDLGLKSQAMSRELIAEAYRLHQKYPRLSVNDLLALTLAKAQGCSLLTGDKALRELAEVFKIEVHGSIWLVQQMLDFQYLDLKQAREAFQKMKKAGSRLPWLQIEEMLLLVVPA